MIFPPKQPEEPPPPVETSTPEVPGMAAAVATLQSEFWKQAKKPSILEIIKREAVKIPLGMLNDLKPFVPLLPDLILNAPTVLKNLKVVPDVPSALVTAAPFVQRMRLDRVLADLSAVPEGKELVDMMRGKESSISLNPNVIERGGLHHHEKEILEGSFVQRPGEITVGAFYTHGGLVAVLAHELQHRKQLLSGVSTPMHEKVPSPLEIVWHNRFIEGDAEATAADIAYKLKQAGKPEAWDFMKKDNLAGAAFAYEAAVEKNPDAVNDGTAKRAAFDAWFDKPQQGRNWTMSQAYNNQGISHFIGKMQLEKMARMGVPFEPLEVADYAKIGALSKVNYLELPGQRALSDDYYRKPDWHAYQAGQLTVMQREYEGVKKEVASDPAITRRDVPPLAERVKPEIVRHRPVAGRPNTGPGVTKPAAPPAGPQARKFSAPKM